jgi:hypothetical protein
MVYKGHLHPFPISANKILELDEGEEELLLIHYQNNLHKS